MSAVWLRRHTGAILQPPLKADRPPSERRGDSAPAPGATARAAIGVSPAAELVRLRGLFDSLEQALPVAFVAPSDEGIEAMLHLGHGEPLPGLAALPTLRLADGSGPHEHLEVALSGTPPLDRSLRGQRLDEERCAAETLNADRGDAILATAGPAPGRPLWVRRPADGTWSETVVASLDPLEETDVLRDQLRPGRFLALTALLHFLREVAGERAFVAPPLRACFMVDDPNLHRRRYGCLDFDRLADHAMRGRYHVAMAAIPLDMFATSAAARGAFTAAGGRLSLLVHGVDHFGAEFMRERSAAEWEAPLAAALRRVARFERSGGPVVERIMVPPHDICTLASMDAMLRLGFEAVSTCWAFPQPPGRPPKGWPLAGFELSQMLVGGLPVIQRWPLVDHSPQELVLRAFLRQPLVVFAHHQDLGDLDRLDEAAAAIDALGEVTWTSPGRIARTNVLTRREGSTLRVRAHSRRFELDVEPGVAEVVVELPPTHGKPRFQRFTLDGHSCELTATAAGWRSEPILVAPGRIEAAFTPRDKLQLEGIPAYRPALTPILRRIATETRDRGLPVARRLRRRI